MEEKQIIEVITNSRSLLQVIETLDWSLSGTSYKKIRAIIDKNSVSTKHFLSAAEILIENNKKWRIPLEEILIENSTYRNRGSLKRRLVNEGLLEYVCYTDGCNNRGEWMGNKISLILDHINGINNDNRLENLRLLCPNCNATLDTHCGKNVKK